MFKKKDIFKVKSIPLDPATMRNPTTADDYMKRGIAFYARKQYDRSEDDLKAAISLDPELVDAYYNLGLMLKAVFRKEESIQAFEKYIDLISNGLVKNHDRAEMLRRLAMGHINEQRTGDWNLEKEIWHRIT